jgi:hypothetical protein
MSVDLMNRNTEYEVTDGKHGNTKPQPTLRADQFGFKLQPTAGAVLGPRLL